MNNWELEWNAPISIIDISDRYSRSSFDAKHETVKQEKVKKVKHLIIFNLELRRGNYDVPKNFKNMEKVVNKHEIQTQ